MGWHLAGQDHHRYGIHKGSRDSRDGVRHAGPARDQTDAYLFSASRIGICRMHSSLFVPNEHVLELLLLVYLVVDIENGPAGVAEDVFNLLFVQATDDDFCASDFHRFSVLSSSSDPCPPVPPAPLTHRASGLATQTLRQGL